MNKIESVIKSKENVGFRFKPTNEFYIKIGIRRKRFGQLVRNEKSATLDELNCIAKYFDVQLNDLIS